MNPRGQVSARCFFTDSITYYCVHAQTVSTRPLRRGGGEWPGNEANGSTSSKGTRRRASSASGHPG